ncbi:MAG: hypothetical protein LBS11_07195 [Oscillospiraceae bacterium]|jgi:hypothetical protein|nr:hypothetical protein [Oscillospiraceae bacterium]
MRNASTAETVLAKHPRSGFLALAGLDFADIMTEELDGLALTFERIKVPGAGWIMFEMPCGEGEPEPVNEFTAVIFCHHPLLCYYKAKYTDGNNPPDCGSFDGETGIGDPGGECKRCPLNQFGSGENGSNARKQWRRIYLPREGEVFPMLLSLPTGSLGMFTRYIKRLLRKGRKTNSAVTRFTLKKETSKGGIVYAQAQFVLDRVLTLEEIRLIEPLAAQVKEYAQRAAFETDASVKVECTVDPETGEGITSLGGN